MRAIVILAVLLLPTASASHSEIVEFVADAVEQAWPDLPADLPMLPQPDAGCTHHVNASGPYFLGIPIPNRVHEARVECRAGERVIVTPDPFYDP